LRRLDTLELFFSWRLWRKKENGQESFQGILITQTLHRRKRTRRQENVELFSPSVADLYLDL
jgi:hypothetical protein